MLWHFAASSLVALAAGFAGGWQVRAWKAGADDTARVEQENSDQLRRTERAIGASSGYEGRRAERDASARNRDKEATRVAQDPLHSRECLSPDGMRLIADEIASRRSPGEPRAAVPAASAAR